MTSIMYRVLPELYRQFIMGTSKTHQNIKIEPKNIDFVSAKWLIFEFLEVSYSYDAFGIILEKTGGTYNPYLYNQQQYDAATGLYYLRARYMNPSTGRFVSMDEYAENVYDPSSLHKYLYASNNPVMYCDPTGYMVGTLTDEMAAVGILGVLLIMAALHYSGVLDSLAIATQRIIDGNAARIKDAILSSDSQSGSEAQDEIQDKIADTSVSTIDEDDVISDVPNDVEHDLNQNKPIESNSGSKYGDKTVKDVLKQKKGDIKKAPLPKGGPNWDDLLPMRMEEVKRAAKAGRVGFRTIWKLLTDGRFDI